MGAALLGAKNSIINHVSTCTIDNTYERHSPIETLGNLYRNTRLRVLFSSSRVPERKCRDSLALESGRWTTPESEAAAPDPSSEVPSEQDRMSPLQDATLHTKNYLASVTVVKKPTIIPILQFENHVLLQ